MVEFDGICPFLTCNEQGPHSHPVCSECGAVRYGNPLYCRTCNVVTNAERAADGYTDPILMFRDAPR